MPEQRIVQNQAGLPLLSETSTDGLIAECPKRNRLWFVVVVLAALAIRLLAAAVEPAFIDEAYVYYTTRVPLEQLFAMLRTETQQPLYNLVMHCLTPYTSSLFLMRLPSVLAGTASVWLAYLLGRQLKDSFLGLILASLIACAYPIWHIDIQARAYGLQMACIIWCLYLMARLHKEGSLPGGCLHLGLASLLCSSWHYLGTIIAGACALSALLLPKHIRWRTVAVIALSWIPAVSWFVYTATSPKSFYATNNGSRAATLRAAVSYPLYLSGWDSLCNTAQKLYAPPQQAAPGNPTSGSSLPLGTLVLNLALWALAVYGWWRLRQENRFQALLLLLAFLLPLAFLSCGTIKGIQIFQNRYLVPSAAPFLLALLWGLRSRKAQLTGAALLLLANLTLIALLPSTPFLYSNYWDGLNEFIKNMNNQCRLTIPRGCW